MVLAVGLDYAGMNRFHEVLRGHHRVKTHVHLLDNANNVLADMTGGLIEGSLDIDADAEVTRSGSMQILDPLNKYDLDSNVTGQKFYNRQVRIYYQVMPLVGPEVFTVPIFTGPITYAVRNAATVDIDFGGKEEYSNGGIRTDYTWPAGWQKISVIRNALQIHAGEINFDFQIAAGYGVAASDRLVVDFTLEKSTAIFPYLRDMAKDIGYRLFYNAWGNCVLRPIDYNAKFNFDTSWLTGEPTAEFDIDAVVNTVAFTGGGDPPMSFEIMAAPDHPYSPQSLARNGVPRYLTKFIENDKITSAVEAYGPMNSALVEGLLRSLDVSATAAVLPYVEEFDVFTITHPRYNGVGVFTKGTIPLVGDSEMSIGFLSTTSGGVVDTTNYLNQAVKMDKEAARKAAYDAAVAGLEKSDKIAAAGKKAIRDLKKQMRKESKNKKANGPTKAKQKPGSKPGSKKTNPSKGKKKK